MAAGDAALPYPIYGADFEIGFPILDNDGDLVVDAAGLDTEISKDLGTAIDATNEAVQVATSMGMYGLALTYLEMRCSILMGKVKSSTADSKDTPFVLYPRRLPILMSGTAQAGANGTITLPATASGYDDYYVAMIVLLTANTGIGQARMITDYVGKTKVASVAPNWDTNPDNTTTLDLLVPHFVTPIGLLQSIAESDGARRVRQAQDAI